MTAFDELRNEGARLRGALSDHSLIRQLMSETARIGDGVLVCQTGGAIPQMSDTALRNTRNQLWGLFRTSPERPPETERDRYLSSIFARFQDFGTGRPMDERGREFARQLNEYLAGQMAVMRNGQTYDMRYHLTYRPQDANGPPRLEVRLQADGAQIARPIFLVEQSDRGRSLTNTLRRIRENNISDLNHDDWRTVFRILDAVADGATGQDRTTRMQALLDLHVNPYLHWAWHTHGQPLGNSGWHIRLVSAGQEARAQPAPALPFLPIQIQFQQWNLSDNRPLVQGNMGYQEQPVRNQSPPP